MEKVSFQMSSTEDLINVVIEQHLQKRKNIESIEDVIKPSTIMTWLLAAGIARPNCSKVWTWFVKLINLAVCSSIVGYGVVDFFFFNSVFKSSTFKIVYYANKSTCYISSYWYIFDGLIQYSKWPLLITKIENIDKKMLNYGMKQCNRLVKKFQIFALISTILLGPFSVLSHSLYYYFLDPEELFTSDLLLYHTISQAFMINAFYDIIVLIIYSRYKSMNNNLKEINQKFTEEMIATEIQRVREIHHGLSKLVRFVNIIHGPQLLLSSLNSFTMIVATLFRIYMGVVENNNLFMLINNVIWLTFFLQFAITCGCCTLTTKESSKTGIIIHEIMLKQSPKKQRPYHFYSLQLMENNNFDDYLRDEINDFSSQMFHCSISFNAYEFFSVDNELLRSFVGVITTYLIILVQFYVPESKQDISTNSTAIDSLLET